MSSSYESSRSRRRGLWSFWVPVLVTAAVATAGVAAWVWSQRPNDEENENEADLDYDNADYGDNPAYGATRDIHGSGATDKTPFSHQQGASYGVTEPHAEATGAAATWGAQMSGALRRTPSPQQFLSDAGKRVAAGVAGVGAAFGSALAAIREEDKNAYADHETWSEEAEARKETASAPSQSQSKDASKRRKTVAIVVSADTNVGDSDGDGDEFYELVSILSHIPRNTDFSKIKLFILIYSPGLKDPTPEAPASNLPPPSLSSSFSNIGHEQAQTPGSETKSPLLGSTSANPAFLAVYSQAVALVEKDTMVMPFSTPNGYVHILRHLQPDVLYLQESLAGSQGSTIDQLQTWLRHDIILVVGAEGGHGGLADSESEAEAEAEQPEKPVLWWQKEERVGRGRGVVVVDSLRLGDDWDRRVQGKE
ncbi:hypothetical protein DL764_007315 [Monosporascus ibericus]|uniref:Peroxin 22-like protein n=1 Tax=Monosporascus ibericus TaxID=155417 RepID=A0A4Q4T5E6_9PEZI|nr:hypothetical protein DL764_007315 [Monosporascus ibericus]